MNLKIMAAAAALPLTAVTAASAQEIYVTEPAYVAPAPVYAAPVVTVPPAYVVSEPHYVVEPPHYTVQTGPRYEYNDGSYDVTYSAPVSCTVDLFGNRYCD